MNTACKLLMLVAVTLLAGITLRAQTITDIDGNVYQTVSIGSQVWMAENLRTTHFSNGVAIATTTTAVNNDYTAMYQWAYNDDANLVPVYGRLYTWPVAIDNRNVCPAGWHVPADTDWVVLGNFLGGITFAGGKMKETGTTHWLATDISVDNSSLFTGLPGGHRGNPMGYSNMGAIGTFWTSTAIDAGSYPRGTCYRLTATNSELTQSLAVGNCGQSIRCIKSTAVGVESPQHDQGLQLFPNPANGQLSIRFNTPGNRRLFVYNMMGALLLEKELNTASEQLDTGSFPKGMYLLKIVGKEGVSERKWLKE